MIDCLRFLDISDMYQIETMSLYEYGIRMKAYELKNIDKEYHDHWTAWINARVKDMVTIGKDKVSPKYRTFKDFFDYKKCLRNAGERNSEESAKEERLKNVARRLQRFNEGRR